MRYIMSWTGIILSTLLMAHTPAYAQDYLDQKTVALGEEVADFSLPDLDGNMHSLSGYRGQVVVIDFWSATCPISAAYEERMKQITADYVDRNVVVLGIDSNKTETVDQIRGVAKQRGVNFPILIDEDNVIADQFGGQTTPHVYVLDAQGVLIYEGGVDDERYLNSSPNVHHLRNVLDEVLAGNPVTVPSTPPWGCSIKRQ